MSTVNEEEEQEYEHETTEESAFRKTTEISDYALSIEQQQYKEEKDDLSKSCAEEIKAIGALPFDEFKTYII